MPSVGQNGDARASGVTRTRCKTCRRFARLLPGELECAKCSGALALEFDTISQQSDASARGGW